MNDNDQLSKIDAKLDKLQEHLASVDVTLAKQEVSLTEHVRRSGLLEENVKMLRSDFTPIQKHVIMIGGALKFLGLISALLVIAETIKSLFH